MEKFTQLTKNLHDRRSRRSRQISSLVMSSLHKWMGVVWVQEKEMKLRNHDIWKLYHSASGNDYTSSMGGTKESSSLDTCKRQNFVCHEYFVPKWHLPGKKTHLWSFPEINNNKRTEILGNCTFDSGLKKNNWDPAFYNQTQIWVLMILSKPVKSKLKKEKKDHNECKR